MENNGLSLQARAEQFPARAEGMEVFDEDSLQRANELVIGAARLIKEINAAFDPLIAEAHSTHQAIIDKKKSFTAPVQETRALLNPKIADYLAEQRRIQREAVEKARKEREEIIRLAREKEKKALQAALAAEEAGKPEEAEKILEEVPAAPVFKRAPAPKAPLLKGSYLRTDIKWRIIDQTLIPRDLWIIDTVAIDRIVRNHGLKTEIPGIETFEDYSSRTRT